MTSGIRGKNTSPEIVGPGLHRLAYRFRVHVADLPSKPNLVLCKHRAVIFAHCFWRQKFRQEHRPRPRFPRRPNHRRLACRDRPECAVKRRARLVPEAVAQEHATWLLSEQFHRTLRGHETRTTA